MDTNSPSPNDPFPSQVTPDGGHGDSASPSLPRASASRARGLNAGGSRTRSGGRATASSSRGGGGTCSSDSSSSTNSSGSGSSSSGSSSSSAAADQTPDPMAHWWRVNPFINSKKRHNIGLGHFVKHQQVRRILL